MFSGNYKIVIGIAIAEFRTTNLGRVKKVDSEVAKEERNINAITYESEWLSDEEFDNEELQELLQDRVQML